MGYKAPSAEAVYRYAFRLDGSVRSLTDGFGFSIVFVNDNSPTCQQLISNYFVDLCYRTADRIRIIFFSDLPTSCFDSIANDLNSGRGRALDGMLGAVIQSSNRGGTTLGRRTDLFHRFLESLRLRDFMEADLLLSDIASSFGPRYADALYRILRESRRADPREIVSRAKELIDTIVDPDYLSNGDPLRRVYDNHWRDLTPAALRPIDAPERTHELSYNAEIMTAMPGVGESMRFAARLGIGRHVPCFLFFTDVGGLSVDALPLVGFTAEEAYTQLRKWIDRFYDENRDVIAKWKQVEVQVTSFTNSIDQPLTTLRNWLSRSESLWEDLRSTAEVVVRLSENFSDHSALTSLVSSIKPTKLECREVLSDLDKKLRNLQKAMEEDESHRTRLQSLISELNAASSFEDIYNAFFIVSKDAITPSGVKKTGGILSTAMADMREKHGLLNVSSPKGELLVWWRRLRQRIPSLKQYKRARKSWSRFLTSSYDEVVGTEYEAIVAAIFDFKLSTSSSGAIEHMKEVVAGIVNTEPTSFEWSAAFNDYSVHLMPFFSVLFDDSPTWVNGNGLVTDVVPFRGRSDGALEDYIETISEDSLLHRLLDIAAGNWHGDFDRVLRDFTGVAQKYRREVVNALKECMPPEVDYSAARGDIVTQFISRIRSVRDDIETELSNIAMDCFGGEPPIRVADGDVERFSALLDEYDRTVKALVYPYQRDRRVRRIELPTSAPLALQIGAMANVDVSTRLRKMVTESTSRSKTVEQLFRKMRDRSYTLTPTSMIDHEVSASTPEPKRASGEILQIESIQHLEQRLQQLDDDSIHRVCAAVVGPNAKANSREEAVKLVLAIGGVMPKSYLSTGAEDVERTQRLRLKELDTLCGFIFERVHAMEMDMDVSASAEKRVEIKQRIRVSLLPRLLEIEREFCEIALTVFEQHEDSYDLRSFRSRAAKVLRDNRLSEYENDEPISSLLRRISTLACEEIQPGEPKVVSSLWREAKSLVRKFA